MIRDPESFNILLDTVSRFVRETLIPRETEVTDTDEIPADIVAQMRQIGLFGLTIPEEYGGLGFTTEEEVMTSMALCYASPVFRSRIGTNTGIGAQGIVIDGTPEQKKKYLPRLATGEITGSFALTEPESGSDAGSLRTTARREGDHYILNGSKRYITNAPEANVFTVMARTESFVSAITSGPGSWSPDAASPSPSSSRGASTYAVARWSGRGNLPLAW